MELKYNNTTCHRGYSECSNRTFMELKFLFKMASSYLKSVLIVPLWN